MERDIDLLVYHYGCPDGIASAWIANKYLNIKEMIGISPGKQIKLIENKKILCVDVCPEINNLQELIKSGNDITIMDHHISNIEMLKDIKGIKTFLNIDKAGCQIVYDEIVKGKKRPWFIDYIADGDLWQWKLENSKFINTGLYSSGYININKLDELLENEDEMKDKMYLLGKNIIYNQNKEINDIIKSVILTKFVDSDYLVFLVNCPRHLRSVIGYILVENTINDLIKKYKITSNVYKQFIGTDKKVDFSAIWHYDFITNEWWISLRGSDHSPDLSQLTSKYNGGGHKKASGFTICKGENLHNYFKLLDSKE